MLTTPDNLFLLHTLRDDIQNELFQEHRLDSAFTDACRYPNTKLFAGAEEGSKQHWK